MKQFSKEEIEVIRMAEEFRASTSAPFWKHVRARMVNHVDDAAAKLEGCAYATSEVKLGLLSAWQQRKAMLDVVDGYIASVIEARKALLEEMAQQNGIDSPEAIELLDAPYLEQ